MLMTRFHKYDRLCALLLLFCNQIIPIIKKEITQHWSVDNTVCCITIYSFFCRFFKKDHCLYRISEKCWCGSQLTFSQSVHNEGESSGSWMEYILEFWQVVLSSKHITLCSCVFCRRQTQWLIHDTREDSDTFTQVHCPKNVLCSH